MRYEYLQLAARLRASGCSYVDIGHEFRARFGLEPLAALRLAHGWSQRDAAQAWNQRWPDDPKTFKNFSYWENWRYSTGYEPRWANWDRLAQLYHCRVTDLIADAGDYRQAPTVAASRSEDKAAADAMARAERLTREVMLRWPSAFTFLDTVRERGGPWPDWCLVPSSAAGLRIGWQAENTITLAVAVTALYTWQWSRSVYVYEPGLVERLATSARPGLDGVGPLRLLGEWCVYLAGGYPQWPGVGAWAFLDVEAETGRPQLWLIVDLADGDLDALVVVRQRLDTDPPTVVPDLAGTPGRWRMVASAATVLTTLMSYPARPDAVLCRAGSKETRPPQRLINPTKRDKIWLVGYSG